MTPQVSDSYPLCEQCKSQRASSIQPYVFDYFTDFKDPFRYPAKQVLKYLCNDCHKILSRNLTPGYIRLREAQELLDGKGDEESDEEESEE